MGDTQNVHGVLFSISFGTVYSQQPIFTALLADTRTPLRACWWAEPSETPLLLHLSVHVRAAHGDATTNLTPLFLHCN